MKLDLGWIPVVLLCLLLSALGIFGSDCQAQVQGGIRSTVRAFQGK